MIILCSSQSQTAENLSKLNVRCPKMATVQRMNPLLWRHLEAKVDIFTSSGEKCKVVFLFESIQQIIVRCDDCFLLCLLLIFLILLLDFSLPFAFIVFFFCFFHDSVFLLLLLLIITGEWN